MLLAIYKTGQGIVFEHAEGSEQPAPAGSSARHRHPNRFSLGSKPQHTLQAIEPAGRPDLVRVGLFVL